MTNPKIAKTPKVVSGKNHLQNEKVILGFDTLIKTSTTQPKALLRPALNQWVVYMHY